LQPTNRGGSDGFIIKITAAGTDIPYSTYLGGSGNDYSSGIAVDAAGNAYVTGTTESVDFPITQWNAFQSSFPGGTCIDYEFSVPCHTAFVTQLEPTGAALLYSTYLGGIPLTGLDWGASIALDPSGIAYVVGITTSPTFPTTPGAFQTILQGSYDAFVVKLPDTTPPILKVPPDTCLRPGTVLDYGLGVSVTDAADPHPQVGCNPPSPIMFPTAGLYTVNCTAVDSSGNEAHKSFAVSVTEFCLQLKHEP
jgi:hypothetical protein